MKWEKKSPVVGDMIRARCKEVYHYGIFVSRDEVIQFGFSPALRDRVSGGEMVVIATDMDAFCVGEEVEVACPELKEISACFSPCEVVNRARSRLGEGGYHILHNNCEHFANECLRGLHYCEQAERVRELFRTTPVVDVYLARLPQGIKCEEIYPPERRAEIERTTNGALKTQKIAVWQLLRHALQHSFGLRIEQMNFEKTENGKWCAPDCEFSLSHCEGGVAVAVSRQSVGVDIEPIQPPRHEGFAKRFLTADEFVEYETREDKNEYLTRCWTAKEAIFKSRGEGAFKPSTIESRHPCVVSRKIVMNGQEHICSVATNTPKRVKIFENIDLSCE